MDNNAYVSLLATDDYLEGILGLKYSMEQVNTKFPLLVICTNTLKKETFKTLENNNIEYIIVSPISFGVKSQWISCANKFYAYNLIKYQKVIFVDADVIFLANMDQYFSLEKQAGYLYDNGHEQIISGGFILLFPNELTFKKAYSFIQKNKNKLCDDEPVFSYLFEQEDSILIETPEYYHFGGQDKYWHHCKSLKDTMDFINNLQKNPQNRWQIHDDLHRL